MRQWLWQEFIQGLKDIAQAFMLWREKKPEELSMNQPVIAPQPVFPPPVIEAPKPAPAAGEKLYAAAFASLGLDASPRDRAVDAFGCAETVDEIYKKAFGHYIGNAAAPALSTVVLDFRLDNSPSFIAVTAPRLGDILVALTVGSTHGHAAICGKTHLMSNSSTTGKFEANYTYNSFMDYFHLKLALRVKIYRPVEK